MARAPESELTTAELQEQIATLRGDISELTAALGRYGKAQAEALKAQAEGGLRHAAERGADGMAAASDFAGRKYAETEDYVRTNPATSMGLAAGLGFLIGLLTARR